MGIVNTIVKHIKWLFEDEQPQSRDKPKPLEREKKPAKKNPAPGKKQAKKETQEKPGKPAAPQKGKKTGKAKQKDVSREIEKELNDIVARRKNEAKKKIMEIKKEADTQVPEEIRRYRSEITRLGKKIEELNKEVERQRLQPRQALGGVQVMYRELKSQKDQNEREMHKTRELMRYLEGEFLRRKVSEEMFRQKMFDYREKMHILEMEKKELETQKEGLRETTERIPEAKKISLEQLSTTNIEKLLKKQQEAFERMAVKQEEKTVPIQTAMKVTTPMKKMEAYPGRETKVEQYAITTDFDRILALVNEKGSMKLGEIAKETGLDRKRVQECCELLEGNRQIVLSYPALGDPKAETPDYRERRELEKMRKKKEKKK